MINSIMTGDIIYQLTWTVHPCHWHGGCFHMPVMPICFAKQFVKQLSIFKKLHQDTLFSNPWTGVAKKDICLFPLCVHLNQWVGRKCILFSILFFCHFNLSVGKNYFLFYLAPDSLPCMSYLYITLRFFVFLTLFDPPLFFSLVFLYFFYSQ